MDSVSRGLTAIGYSETLLQWQYDYALLQSSSAATGHIDLAAFGATPPSYRNACIGVVVANGSSGTELVSRCRDLGAPLVLELQPKAVHRWGFDGRGHPRHLERVATSQISNLFRTYKAEWAPQSILRAKALHDKQKASQQLDFYDAGFLPLVESLVSKKLDNLLRETLRVTVEAYKGSKRKTIDAQELFRLVFRFLAGKILVDRGALSSTQIQTPAKTLQAVDEYYNMAADGVPSTKIDDAETLHVAWESIQLGLDFRNLSADDLAFIYENTLVSLDTRKKLGTHATPPSVAEYITGKLPFEDLTQATRRVLEPCSGHGVFLLSAMRRLRDLLPPGMTDAQRHRYLKARLVGIEMDAFAVEVARLSLMLADYPNKNDWKLHNEDVFSGNRLRDELTKSDCVLCNPPYEDFSKEERAGLDLESVHKPMELLRRILTRPPKMLGLVLPKSFLSKAAAQGKLAEEYRNIEIVALPDHVFSHSDSETVLLMAWGKSGVKGTSSITCRDVTRNDLDAFLRHGKEPSARNSDVEVPEKAPSAFSLWLPRLSQLWKYLSDYPRLDEYAEIHRGVEYTVPVSEDEEDERRQTFSRKSREGFKRGLFTSKDTIAQYSLLKTQYLRIEEEIMKGDVYKKYPWWQPKLFCNAAAKSRGPWRLTAALDNEGLYAYQRLHAVWQKGECNLYVILALLNSPVANGYIFEHEGKRDVRRRTLYSIPVPVLDASQRDAITHATKRLLKALATCESERALLRKALLEVDALILQAYDLPPRLERELLDTFQGYERPVPNISFTGYYPEGFTACFPLHEIISGRLEKARVGRLLDLLKPINDPIIHEALTLFRGDDS